MTVRMKAGDTTPSAEVQLTDADGTGVDLDEVDEVLFELQDRHGDPVFSKEADITDDITGRVEYNWDAEDTERSGDFRGQFVVVYTDGNRLSTPTRGWIDVFIERR